MKYYSTQKQVEEVSLKDAVIKGLAADGGLFMPKQINKLPLSFFENIENLSFHEISYQVAKQFFANDIPSNKLKEIVCETLSFDCPVVDVNQNISSLELFHGPTLAFKDVGARFMARLLSYFLSDEPKQVNVIVATSGDTGSAVANGFLGVDGVQVYVLYPKNLVSAVQEMQFASLGQNITPIEVEGTFDDCQALVKQAFLHEELNKSILLSSANSINVARFLPQAFYYFYAYAQLKKKNKHHNLVVSVPSGNFGNLTAGMFAQEMGLPIKRFIAANNENDVVYKYLKTGNYEPQASVATIANAMDVGNPSNFARIAHLYPTCRQLKQKLAAYRYSDEQIKECLARVYKDLGYLLDPHGACAYRALEEGLEDEEQGLFLETAHPAKFIDTVEQIIGKGELNLPPALQVFMQREKKSILMPANFDSLKNILLT